MKNFAILVTVLCMASMACAGTILDATMDVDSGTVAITASGFDHTTWHTGSIGQTDALTAMGGFSGTFKANEGSYGALNTFTNLASKDGGAAFTMTGTQDFNVLSGNHINNVLGGFYAFAAGGNNQVAMNLKSIGSMYIFSEATNPYSSAALRGNAIEKEVWTTKNGAGKTDLYLGVWTDGVATMTNSNIWGFGIMESGASTTNYGGGTRTITATGTGTFQQNGYGQTALNFNGFVLPAGGTASLSGNFNSGFSGIYQMDAS